LWLIITLYEGKVYTPGILKIAGVKAEVYMH